MKYTAQDAIKFIRAFEAGKKIRGSYKKGETLFEVESWNQLGECLFDVDARYTLTLAPEPKKLFRVVNANGGSVICLYEDKANAACVKWDAEYPSTTPHTVEEYVQVMP